MTRGNKEFGLIIATWISSQVHGAFERNTLGRGFLKQNILFILCGENVHKRLTHGRSPQFKASCWLILTGKFEIDRYTSMQTNRFVLFACNCGFTNVWYAFAHQQKTALNYKGRCPERRLNLGNPSYLGRPGFEFQFGWFFPLILEWYCNSHASYSTLPAHH